jgi:H+-transporting ATPase
VCGLGSVRRNGVWAAVPVRELVPGDVLLLTIGCVIPADARVLECDVELSIDESSLTGESLPVAKNVDDELLSGSVLRQGEGQAVVERTGEHTFFGKTIVLLAGASGASHLYRTLTRISYLLSGIGAVLQVALLFVMVFRDGIWFGEALNMALAVMISVAPIGINVICTTTMAVGSRELTAAEAIVTRLSAIEELAGMGTHTHRDGECGSDRQAHCCKRIHQRTGIVAHTRMHAQTRDWLR